MRLDDRRRAVGLGQSGMRCELRRIRGERVWTSGEETAQGRVESGTGCEVLEHGSMVPTPLPSGGDRSILTSPPISTAPRPPFPPPAFNANCHRLTLGG